MNKIFLNNIGDLAEAQRASFFRFLFLGISEELSSFPNPFLTKIKIPGRKKIPYLVYHYPNELKLAGPTLNTTSCLIHDTTYAIQLYVPGEYSYLAEPEKKKKKHSVSNSHLFITKNLQKIKSKRIRIKQDIFFGEVPLMTEEGTFIISGCERIVISQIIRSPGIYFRKEFGTSRKTIYTATIISNKGLWTKFVLDQTENKTKKISDNDSEEIGENSEDRIYIKLNEFKSKYNEIIEIDKELDISKLFIFDLIRYFGLTIEEILDTVKYPLHLTAQQLTRNEESEDDDEDTCSLINTLFLNQRSGCFSIGEIGRYKINKRLGLNLPKEATYLTSHDFIGIIDGLIELKYYNRLSDDIDDIKNKQIRCVGELLQNQIRVGLYRLEKNLIEEISPSSLPKINIDFEPYTDLEPDDWIIDPRPLTSAIKEFFKTSQLSQFMDQINPLSELTHKRKISVFGPNGLKRDHISTVIRDIHPSQYGRLCPI